MATMERPRPSSEEETTTEAPAPAVVEEKKVAVEEKLLPSNPEEAVSELEKRLEDLGGAPTPVAEDKKEDIPAPAPAPVAKAPVAAPVAAAKPAAPPAAAPAAAAGHKAGKNALLARIMAAQEKAKAAEASRMASEAEFAKPKEQVKQEAATKTAEEAQAEIMMKLSGKPAAEKKPAEAAPAPPPFEVAEAGMAPPPFSVAEAGMKSEPPPPFEVAEKAAPAMPPPDFGAVEQTLKPPSGPPPPPAVAAPPAPSAPTFDPLAEPPAAATTSDLDFLHEAGIERVVPPPAATEDAAAPPSFEQFEANSSDAAAAPDIDESLFELDELGNALSPEEKRKMIEEQRAIMAAIEKEAAANKAAIAEAQAENFEQRSGAAAVRAVNDGPRPTSSSAGRSAAVGAPMYGSAAAASAAASASDTTGTVDIGEGQKVALHGQEKTKKAIADGTAILVQCINCQNWMQVTESATLMFCPVCQVVSPVMKQDDVHTKEEALQLSNDHKLAMQLQAEINAEAAAEDQDRRNFEKKQGEEEEGYISYIMRKLKGEEAPSSNTESLVPGSSGEARRVNAGAHEKSWFDTFSEYVSVGVASGAPAQRSGEIGVSRPPGASGGLTSASPYGQTSNVAGEQRGLLAASVDGPPVPMAGMGSARVAESKPLFSCVMDSVSSAAAAAADTVQHYAQGDDEGGSERREGLLSVTGAGRGDGGGSYHQIG